jgi:hypothetical protein
MKLRKFSALTSFFVQPVRTTITRFLWPNTSAPCERSLGTIKVKKVKFTPEQAMKAQRGSRGIALLFL